VLMERLPQVHSIARRIHDRLPPHVQLGDLIDAGVVGLLEALQNYDPSKHVELKTFAKFRIRGAILDNLRELDWSPRPLRRKARLLEDAHQRLRHRLGRPATEPELAAELGLSLGSLQRLLGDLRGLDLASLQAELAEGRGEAGASLGRAPAAHEDPYSQCLRAELRGLLTLALGDLSPRERQVLALYYYEELTMQEVGEVLGVAEARISQMHSAALVRLRARMRQLLDRSVAPPAVAGPWPPDLPAVHRRSNGSPPRRHAPSLPGGSLAQHSVPSRLRALHP